ncbi:MAG TPA: tRNA (adenosine(37)-N6)-threonylcarbamoyltransferase complex transferase subunit TsaD [Lacipirellulaceae bacterium]|nr:tRNA (adenosine(37)-N6)-threonylcarbamoyltransferase complex transferase subunit TsaD [Lacipirellulaceae bacterium]
MNLLTIETTCDETAAAVVTDRLEVLASVVASQDALHERFSGVVPEIASRAHVERILPVIDETLRKAGLKLADLDAVAVANTPGLAGSLLVGLTAAKALCLACNLPLVAVNHLQAHIYACRMASGRDVFPCVGLIVSGGHSNIYRCETAIDFTPLGGTIDDAAGEAFDKVASLLGLPYPGGPSIERAARGGDPHKHRFPRPLLDDQSRLDFSFSGLKTAVRYLVAGPGKLGAGSREPGAESGQLGASSAPRSPLPAPSLIADIAASFQEAVIDCLVGKAELALEKTGFSTLCVGGGVAANRRFRDRLEESSAEHGYELFVPPLQLCTDNAVMGAIALERLKAGKVEDLSLDIHPGPERASSQ